MDALGFAVQGELEEEYLLISHFFLPFTSWTCGVVRYDGPSISQLRKAGW